MFYLKKIQKEYLKMGTWNYFLLISFSENNEPHIKNPPKNLLAETSMWSFET
jgi:hypothetical protein